MKNKILSYLLWAILVLSMWFITPYVDAQEDIKSCEEICKDNENKNKCIEDCNQKRALAKKNGEKEESCPGWCCGIKLNTNFPGFWKCIKYESGSTNATNVFPSTMSILTKFIMSIILVVCFIMIIIAWVMWAAAGEDSSKTKTAKGIIEKVAITILLLWFSGVILRLINPNFFG